jgi:hypothetical protein
MSQLLTFAGSLSLLSLCLSPGLLLYYTFSVIRGNGRLFVPETAQNMPSMCWPRGGLPGQYGGQGVGNGARGEQ